MKEINLEMAKRGLDATRRYTMDVVDAASIPPIRTSTAILGKEASIIAVHRMDGAGFLTTEIAIKKAWLSIGFNIPTLMEARMIDIDKMRGPEPGNIGLGLLGQHRSRFCPVAGGIPIRDDDMCAIGAVGTSGCPMGMGRESDTSVSQAAWSAMYDRERPELESEERIRERKRREERVRALFKIEMKLDRALEILDSAEKVAENMGVRCSMAIADENGWLVALHRMDGAKIPTVDIAWDKAWTAASFRMHSSEISKYGNSTENGYGLKSTEWNERLTTIPGGIPIEDDGKIIGGIGISGGETEQDVTIATRAIKS